MVLEYVYRSLSRFASSVVAASAADSSSTVAYFPEDQLNGASSSSGNADETSVESASSVTQRLPYVPTTPVPQKLACRRASDEPQVAVTNQSPRTSRFRQRTGISVDSPPTTAHPSSKPHPKPQPLTTRGRPLKRLTSTNRASAARNAQKLSARKPLTPTTKPAMLRERQHKRYLAKRAAGAERERVLRMPGTYWRVLRDGARYRSFGGVRAR